MRKRKYRKVENKNFFIRLSLKGKLRKIVFFCIMLIMTLGIISGVYIWGKKRYESYIIFFSEFRPAFAPGDNRQEYVDLNFNTSFNLLFVGLDIGKSGHIKADAAFLIHFDSTKQVFQIIALPCKSFYFVSEVEDYYQLDNVYAFGQLETPSSGMDIMRTTLEDNLALSIDGYLAMDIEMLKTVLKGLNNIVIQNEHNFTDNELAGMGLRNDFAKGKIRLSSDDALGYIMADEGGFLAQSQRHYTLLNSLGLMLDRQLIFRILGHLKDYKGLFSNISSESLKNLINFGIENKDNIIFHFPGLLAEDRAVNEKIVPVFSTMKFDQRISEIFVNQDVKLEQARIEIYNGTSSNGLAGKYSRYITNFGGDITRISSKSGEYDDTLIFTGTPEKYENTLRNLQLIFRNSKIIENYPDFSVTGDIIIIIGKDSEM